MASKIHTPSQHVLVRSLNLGTITSSNGGSIDTTGYEVVQFVFDATTSAASTLDAQLQESADNTTWTNVSGGAIAQVVASQTGYVRTVDVSTTKRARYLRWVYTVSGTVVAAVLANLFMPEQYPVTQDNATLTLV
jgi:hypothetical protein